MAVVNFTINSDFKWVLLAMALTWAGSIAAFLAESTRSTPGRAAAQGGGPVGTLTDLDQYRSRASVGD
jgi:hypothetical protein